MVLKVLLAASGSVAAVKVPRIALDLLKFAEVSRSVDPTFLEHFASYITSSCPIFVIYYFILPSLRHI